MTKNQKDLLTLILSKCHDGRLIISESEFESQTQKICQNCSYKKLLRYLEREEFIQVIHTDRHDEPFLYILLLKRANFYFKEQTARKKEVVFKILLAVVSAVITFILGKILYAIFS